MIVFITPSPPVDCANSCSVVNDNCTAADVCRRKRTFFIKDCGILMFPRPADCSEDCLTAYRTYLDDSVIDLGCVCETGRNCLIEDIKYVKSLCDPAPSTPRPASTAAPAITATPTYYTSGAASMVCWDSLGLVCLFAAVMKLLHSAS